MSPQKHQLQTKASVHTIAHTHVSTSRLIYWYAILIVQSKVYIPTIDTTYMKLKGTVNFHFITVIF
jgi:hypothetical protein